MTKMRAIPPCPPCFPGRVEYSAYMREATAGHMSARIRPLPLRPVYCRDCTPAYASAMRRAGRCTNPQVMFRWTSVCSPPDAEVIGCSPTWGGVMDAAAVVQMERELASPAPRRWVLVVSPVPWDTGHEWYLFGAETRAGLGAVPAVQLYVIAELRGPAYIRVEAGGGSGDYCT